MSIPTLSTPPTTPQRLTDTPAEFVTNMDAWLTYEAGLSAELNAFGAGLQATVSGVDFNGTSTTSLAIGTGTKSFTASTGKLWNAGQWVIAASASGLTNYMIGQVTSYNSGTGALVLEVPTGGTGGSGTKTDWVLSMTDAPTSLPKSGGTMTGAITTATPASGQEALIVPHGAAPSAPTNGSIWSTTAALFARINGATQTLMTLAGGTLTGLLSTVASAAVAGAGFRLPHGTAPNTPVNGDKWTTTGGEFTYINGTTRTTVFTDLAQTLTNKRLQDPFYTIADGAGFAINPANGLRQKVTLGANRTPTVSGWASGDKVELWIDDGTGYTVDWSTINPTHIGGTAPTLETTGWTKVIIEYDGSTYFVNNVTPQDQLPAGINYVGGKTSTGTLSSSTTTPNITLTGLTGGLASSPSANDFVIVTVAASSTSDLNISMTSGGWTEHQDLYANASSSDTNLAIYYKSMGSTPDASFDLSIPASNGCSYAVAVQVFRGVDTTTPLDTTSTTANGTASVLVNPASITPVSSPNCLVICGAGSASNTIQTFTASYLSNFLSVGSNNATIGCTVGMGYLKNIVAAYDGAAWTYSTTDNASYSNYSCTMLLRAA